MLEGHRGHYPGIMLAVGCACRTSGVCRTHNAYNHKPRDAKQTQDVIMNAMSVAGRSGPGCSSADDEATGGVAAEVRSEPAAWLQLAAAGTVRQPACPRRRCDVRCGC